MSSTMTTRPIEEVDSVAPLERPHKRCKTSMDMSCFSEISRLPSVYTRPTIPTLSSSELEDGIAADIFGELPASAQTYYTEIGLGINQAPLVQLPLTPSPTQVDLDVSAEDARDKEVFGDFSPPPSPIQVDLDVSAEVTRDKELFRDVAAPTEAIPTQAPPGQLSPPPSPSQADLVISDNGSDLEAELRKSFKHKQAALLEENGLVETGAKKLPKPKGPPPTYPRAYEKVPCIHCHRNRWSAHCDGNMASECASGEKIWVADCYNCKMTGRVCGMMRCETDEKGEKPCTNIRCEFAHKGDAYWEMAAPCNKYDVKRVPHKARVMSEAEKKGHARLWPAAVREQSTQDWAC
ncbi:hypothetical protein CC86DRAFT_385698 [Ophiobolus disseminans]|uniref:Uncharacterized protein n=1 Tax=Ophiobolus disseminans TaxID=1469910 RepID=A0A6A6ZM39_9PLEO|nr:hypothetical protein CC86DRAFT_385698 [Ophiobolus disseminans]